MKENLSARQDCHLRQMRQNIKYGPLGDGNLEWASLESFRWLLVEA